MRIIRKCSLSRTKNTKKLFSPVCGFAIDIVLFRSDIYADKEIPVITFHTLS